MRDSCPQAGAGGANSRRDALSLRASPKVHQSQRTLLLFLLFFLLYETVEMTQRFLTQSPFHRKIPNQLLVATDRSHKSRRVIPGRSRAAYAAPAPLRAISRSDAIASPGAKPALKAKRGTEPIQSTTPKPGDAVLLPRLPAGPALITGGRAQTTGFFISWFLA